MSRSRPDTVESTQESRLLKQVEEATRLDLTGNDFNELMKLSSFRNLNELILDQNGLRDLHFEGFPSLPKLKTLSLNKNEIEDLDQLLDILRVSCPSLTYLSLLGNPACPYQLIGGEETEDDYRCYRLYVLYKIPSLKALDCSMYRGTDWQEASRQGPFLKTVKPAISSCLSEYDRENKTYKPLPSSSSESESSSAKFGKNHQTYTGKYSEGNRFIRSKDL